MTTRLWQQLSLADRIGRGAFGDVFAPKPGDRAIKLLRQISDPTLSHVPPYVFAAETDALRIASSNPILAPHCPTYFGQVIVQRVIDESGADVSGNYWLELAFEMQRLAHDPDERKFGSFFNEDEWHLMQPLERAFEEAGIMHLGDASVLHWRTGRPTVIDFATSDAAAQHARIDPTVP